MCKNNIEPENSIACGKVIVTTFFPPLHLLISSRRVCLALRAPAAVYHACCLAFMVLFIIPPLSILRHPSPSSAIPDKFVKSSNGMSAWKGVWSISSHFLFSVIPQLSSAGLYCHHSI